MAMAECDHGPDETCEECRGDAFDAPDGHVHLVKNPETGEYCSVCFQYGMTVPQVMTPGGESCRFGHGGVDGLSAAQVGLASGADADATPGAHATAEEAVAAVLEVEAPTVPVQAAPTAALAYAAPRAGAFDYVYDCRSANCSACKLKPTADTHAPGRMPKSPEAFNGLMIVYGYPTQRAIRLGDPSGGEHGLLQQTLRRHNVSFDDSYVTNAIACNVPYDMGGDIPAEVYEACRSKLAAEIKYIQPRVILAIGPVAFTALMGEESVHKKRVPYACSTCAGELKYRRWGCAKCKKDFAHLPWTDAKVLPTGTPWDHNCDCVQEDGSHQYTKKGNPVAAPKWQKRVITCTECGGLKTTEEVTSIFKCNYAFTGKGGMAGGAFTIDRTPWADLYPEETHQQTFLLGTYDPVMLRRTPTTKAQKAIMGQFLYPAFDAHIRKLSRLLKRIPPQWSLEWESTKDPLVLRAFMEAMGEARGGHIFDLDIETDSKEPISVTDIRCVGIHNRWNGRTLVLDTTGMGAQHELVVELARWTSDPRISWCTQNGSYDWRVIHRLWGIPEPKTWCEDTLTAHTILIPDAPHDLGHIAFEHTDAPPWKPPKNVNGFETFDSPEQLWVYNARDCRATGLSAESMKVQLEAEGVKHLLDFDMRKQRLALRMGRFGVPINREVMLQRLASEKYTAERALNAMREIVGFVPDELVSDGAKKDAAAEKRDPRLFNPNSNPQLQWALYQKLRLAPVNPTSPSADKEALRPHVEQPFVQQLLRFRGATKIGSTIGNIPIGQDGRFHPEWKPQGARTGRWSSSPNFQNWQGGTKTMVQAPEGRCFVGADYSQLELRLIAALSGDEKMIELCANAQEDRKLEPEYDPHSYITAISFGETFTSLSLKDPSCTAKKDYTKTCLCETCRRKTYRDITKRTIYALAYGGDEYTVLDGIYNDGYDGPPITIRMVQRTVDAYFTGFAKVKPWREGVLQEAKRTGYVREFFGGRYRCFPLGAVDDTVAYNYGVQGSAAAVMDVSAITLDEQLQARWGDLNQIFATVHDAVYVECDIAHALEVANLVETCLSTEVRFNNGPWMALPASAQIAFNWKEAA